MNILLIEDNLDHIEIITDTLFEAYPKGVNVTTTTNLSDGIGKLNLEDFDICLCDLKLPDSPITNTINILSNTYFATPIIVLTSISNDSIAIDLIKAGIQDFIAKDKLDTEYLFKQCSFAIERKAMAQNILEKTTDYEAFCHSLSHDFNSALRRVQQCMHFLNDSLKRNFTLDEEQTKWIEHIISSASDAQRLTNDLYEYLNAENKTETQSFTDLNIIVKKIIDDHNTNETVVTLLHCELPTIKGNSAQLELALKNIIDNSIKYSVEEPKISFSFFLEHIKKHILIYIDDNGIGIPENKSKEIFLPFRRLENNITTSGSGLGLSLVSRIIKHLNGNIHVKPSQLGGSQFVIKLPINRLMPKKNECHRL